MCFAHGGIWVPYWILPILVFAGRSKRVSLKPPRAKEKLWRPEHTGRRGNMLCLHNRAYFFNFFFLASPND